MEHGTYENSFFNKPVKQMLSRASDEVYLLADKSKLDKRALSLVLGLKDIDVLITEPVLEKEQISFLELNEIRTEFCKE